MNSDNAISSCHLQEWYRWAKHAWKEAWERVWDAGGQEKGEGVTGLRARLVVLAPEESIGSESIVTTVEE
jgi:hypothetical protein